MSNGIIPGFLVQNLLYLLYQETDLVEQRKPANITKQYWTNLTIDFLFLFQKIVICVSPAWETTGNFRQARQTGHMRFFFLCSKGSIRQVQWHLRIYLLLKNYLPPKLGETPQTCFQCYAKTRPTERNPTRSLFKLLFRDMFISTYRSSCCSFNIHFNRSTRISSS